MARPGYKLTRFIFKADDVFAMDSMGVYKVFHVKKPNDFYIGSTISKKRRDGWRGGFYTRWCLHLSKLRRNDHESKKLQSVVDKYGIDGIRFTIVEITAEGMARIREQEIIDLLKPAYNKQVRLVSQFDMGGNFIKTFKCVMEAGDKTGIDYTSISSNCSNRRPSAGGFLWAYDSNKPTIPNKRVIHQLTLEGEFVREFYNLEDIKKEFKITSSTSIRGAMSGRQNKAYGYKWKEVMQKNST